MIKYLKIIVIISLLVSNSRTCVDYIYSIHPMVANIGDAFTTMEANMRIQYNTLHLERAKVLKTQYDALDNLRKDYPKDLCKYQGTEESISFQQMGQEMINSVKKNLIYSTKASFDEVRLDHINYVFAFIQSMSEFVDDFFEPAKTYFADGKACVIGLEKNLKSYLETGASRIIGCMRNGTVTNPLMPPKFKSYIDFMSTTYTKQGTDMRKPFLLPVFISLYSTKKQNESAAEALLKVIKIINLGYCGI